jgi:phage portal protein BeeE
VTHCTSIIADTIAGLPWRVVRGDYEQLPVPDWISDPQATRLDGRVVGGPVLDVRFSAVEFWAQWITAALWLGDGYIYCPVRDATGAPKPPLWQLHPHDVQIEAGTYWVGDVPLPSGSILHLRGKPPYNDGHGRGVLDTHGLELGLAATVRSYASGVFASGVPAGFLKSSQPNLSQKAATDLKGGVARAAWRRPPFDRGTKRHNRFPRGRYLTRRRPARKLARMVAARYRARFRRAAVHARRTGRQLDVRECRVRMIELRTFTLLPWQRRIESVLGSEWPRGTGLKIATEGLLRADTRSRYEGYKLAIESGWLTVDEVRALEDRAPFGDQGVA